MDHKNLSKIVDVVNSSTSTTFKIEEDLMNVKDAGWVFLSFDTNALTYKYSSIPNYNSIFKSNNQPLRCK